MFREEANPGSDDKCKALKIRQYNKRLPIRSVVIASMLGIAVDFFSTWREIISGVHACADIEVVYN